MPSFISPQALLDHWQGHRRLTRRVIDTFPEEHLHLLRGRHAAVRRAGDRDDQHGGADGARRVTATGARRAAIAAPNSRHPAPVGREHRRARYVVAADSAGAVSGNDDGVRPVSRQSARPRALCIDNEIHHRGQGYVYLRALGIEPPPFYERGLGGNGAEAPGSTGVAPIRGERLGHGRGAVG